MLHNLTKKRIVERCYPNFQNGNGQKDKKEQA